MNIWAKRIHDLREDNDISKPELAKYLNISTRTLSRYEEGLGNPTLEVLIKLSERFNVSIDYIVGTKPFELTDFKEIREEIKRLEKLLGDAVTLLNKQEEEALRKNKENNLN